MSGDRERSVLEHIVDYCEQIEEAMTFFGKDYKIFISNNIYRNACCMCLLQIGELTNILTEDFRRAYSGVPWRQIKGFRNIVAHAYGTVEPSVVWEIITADLTELKAYCERIIADMEEKEEEESSENRP